MFEGVAEKIAAEAEDARPDDAAERVEQKKRGHDKRLMPASKRRERPQHGDEATEEHDLAAVALEQILAELQPPLVEPDIAAVSRSIGKPNSRPTQ